MAYMSTCFKDRVTAPCMQVRSNSIIIYDQLLPEFSYLRNRQKVQVAPDGTLVESVQEVSKTVDRTRTEAQVENEKNLTRGKYNGYMSPKTANKVKRLLDCWINGIIDHQTRLTNETGDHYYITFYTCTLPAKQSHDDNFLKRNVMMRFIEDLKQLGLIKYYFWRAEPQKNGNIHFHCIFDKYIKYSYLDVLWYRLLERYGYLDKWYKDHETTKASDVDISQMIGKPVFEDIGKGGLYRQFFTFPPGTEIHKIERIDNVLEYLVKYCCKSPDEEELKTVRKISGRLWGCSDQLRSLRYYSEFCTRDTEGVIDAVKSDPKTKFTTEQIDSEGKFHYTIIYNYDRNILPLWFRQKLDEYYESQIVWLYMYDEWETSFLKDLEKPPEKIPKMCYKQLEMSFS